MSNDEENRQQNINDMSDDMENNANRSRCYLFQVSYTAC